MYSGAGAAPMLTAAAAWNGLAVELDNTASTFDSVIMRLTSDEWLGPASLSMVAAAQPLLVWLNHTAEATARAATQAMASAAAFEAAFARTVPPAEVAANRALLAELVATDIVGENASAIAAAEARYSEMWAQDALSMYDYAASSAIAGKLEPLTSPSDLTNPAGAADQAAAIGQAAASGSAEQVELGNLIAKGPEAVMSLLSPLTSSVAGTELKTIIHEIDTLAELPMFHNATHALAGVADYSWNIVANQILISAGNQTHAIGSAAIAGGSSLKTAIAATPPLAAALGKAASVGSMSVPPTWAAAAPEMAAGANVHLVGWAAPEEDELVEGVLPAPGMAADVDDPGAGPMPRYGIKPIVMPKHGF